MKENDNHIEWMDADFDARCKALLENRTVNAPKPRADMFASDARKWGLWVAAGLLLSTGVGVTVIYDAGNQTAPSALPEQAIEVPANAAVEEAISLPVEGEVTDVVLPVDDQPGVAEPKTESSVVQPREMEGAVAAADAGEDAGEDAELKGAQELPVQDHALIEVEAQEVTEQATEAWEEETQPNTSLPSEVNSTESTESKDNAESEAEGPILKLPLTVKPGGGHR